MPRFSPSGFFGPSRCLIPTPGLTIKYPMCVACVGHGVCIHTHTPIYTPTCVFDRCCFHYCVRKGPSALLEAVCARILVIIFMNIAFFLDTFFLLFFWLCVPGLCQWQKFFFRPSRPGLWLARAISLVCDYTCVLVMMMIAFIITLGEIM